jgi:putative hydrolase of the HAD superfamily
MSDAFHNPPSLPWREIDTVFLDMDGTLLDLHFDNQFWLEHVPARFAEENALSVEQAKQRLYPRFKAVEGTIQWYCIDHWSRELSLDIALLKQELEHLIQVRPHVRELLEKLNAAGKRVAMLTNAHHKVIELKMRTTGLDSHFDRLICSHSFACPKEDARFWPRLAESDPFDPQTTLFIDDSLPVLCAARDFGIRHLRAVRRPDSRSPPRDTGEFIAVETFEDLVRELEAGD